MLLTQHILIIQFNLCLPTPSIAPGTTVPNLLEEFRRNGGAPFPPKLLLILLVGLGELVIILSGNGLAFGFGFEWDIGPAVPDFPTSIFATSRGKLDTAIATCVIAVASCVVLEVPAAVILVSSGSCGWVQGLDLGVEVIFHCMHLCHDLLQPYGFYSIRCGWC